MDHYRYRIGIIFFFVMPGTPMIFNVWVPVVMFTAFYLFSESACRNYHWKWLVSFLRVIFGMRFTKTRSLNDVESIGPGITYLKNYQPVYGIQVLFGSTGSIKFGSSFTSGWTYLVEQRIK